MRILGFDTATRATAVALCELGSGRGFELEARDDPPPGARPAHTARLMGLITDLMQQAVLGWDDIDRIAVGVGPGTFTGLRIGIATARALARAREIPIVGISTLRSLALGGQLALAADEQRVDAILAVLDARRHEVFAAAWRPDENANEPLLGPVVLAPGALLTRMPALGSSMLAIGEGAVEFRAVLARRGVHIPGDASGLHRVTAINHCRLAYTLPGSGPDDISPQYLRLPDAEITRRARAGK